MNNNKENLLHIKKDYFLYVKIGMVLIGFFMGLLCYAFMDSKECVDICNDYMIKNNCICNFYEEDIKDITINKTNTNINIFDF